MNIIKRNNISTAESLSASANSILAIFSKTITDLSEVCLKTREQAANKQKEIDQAQIEKDKLEKVAEKNEQIIAKFQEFLG